jgi:hypothetical protein
MTEGVWLGRYRNAFDIFQRGDRTGQKFESLSSIEPPEKLGENQASSDNPDERDAHRSRRQLSKATAVQSLAL